MPSSDTRRHGGGHHNNKSYHHGSGGRSSDNKYRRSSGVSWCGLSPWIFVLMITLFFVIIGVIVLSYAYSYGWYVQPDVIVIDQQSQSTLNRAVIPAEPPRIDRQIMTVQIGMLMDYYQRLNVNVTGMNALSRECYNRLVKDVRFKQMTAALIEMIRYDVCLAEAPEEIVYKARTWYGYAPKKGGVDLVEALYCQNCV